MKLSKLIVSVCAIIAFAMCGTAGMAASKDTVTDKAKTTVGDKAKSSVKKTEKKTDKTKKSVKETTKKKKVDKKSSSKKPAKVNINKASKAALMTIPGVAPKTADEILKYRKVNGKIKNADDLLNVKGIGPKVLKNMKPSLLF